MGRPAGWMKELTGRSAMKSPGKPCHRRDVERWFWREVAKGLSSEDAAGVVGVSSAAGSRVCCKDSTMTAGSTSWLMRLILDLSSVSQNCATSLSVASR